ncbi:cation:proton antiporter [Candidatus Parcubacteria bacterium]|nr:MAG: cation:proton antiporter [Candidatus Parcubacteria bacterium]
MTEIITHFVLQVAVILIVAKIFGAIFEKFGQSAVLGELIGGIIFGPYALGAVSLPFLGSIFPLYINEFGLPVTAELYSLAQLGAIVLLFMVGLETDARMFVQYGAKALLIAVGGVVLPFFFGAYLTIFFGLAQKLMDPIALFVGAAMTATSVGITARVLSDIMRLDTHEGVSILGAAVIDDILGILILALVLSLAGGQGEVSVASLGMIFLKAAGFLAGVTILGLTLGKKLARYLSRFEGKIYMVVILAVCFLIAALAEKFGLAMIIGAYLSGILFSVTQLGYKLERNLIWLSHVLVPIFFFVMGMMVDVKAMGGALVFGLVLTVFAILGKVLGCGVPAWFSGFNFLGSIRIGIGMLPRGEVALIIAGIGLAAGIVTQQIFGVVIMMTILTTVIAPILLVSLFKINKSGLKENAGKTRMKQSLSEPFLCWENYENVLNLYQNYLIHTFMDNGYLRVHDDEAEGIYELQHDKDKDRVITVRRKDEKHLYLDCSPQAADEVKHLVPQVKERINDAFNSNFTCQQVSKA